MLTGGLLAIAGGGPLTALVFEAVDRREPADESLDGAAAVLRGGTWIGGLERAAIFATLVAGWPEGLAVVLAVKGLGRYPELRRRRTASAGTAERFIIGTFTSVLWAVACAGVVAQLRDGVRPGPTTARISGCVEQLGRDVAHVVAGDGLDPARSPRRCESSSS